MQISVHCKALKCKKVGKLIFRKENKLKLQYVKLYIAGEQYTTWYITNINDLSQP